MATYRRARSTRLLVVALLLTSLVTITVDSRGGERGPLAGLGRVGLGIVAPLQEGVAAVFRPVGSFFSNIFRAGSLAEHNRLLQEELAEVRRESQEFVELQRLVREYEAILDLRESLGLEQVEGARVVAEAPSNFEWSVVIDKGTSDGVDRDMAVVAGEGLVGRVVAVTPTSATVRLIIDPESAVPIRLSESGERGLLIGRRDADLRLDLVSPDAEIVPGQRVVTSGYRLSGGPVQGIFPPGIAVGQVSVLEGDPGGFQKVVYVRPYVDFSRLDVVAVVKSAAPQPPSDPGG